MKSAFIELTGLEDRPCLVRVDLIAVIYDGGDKRIVFFNTISPNTIYSVDVKDSVAGIADLMKKS